MAGARRPSGWSCADAKLALCKREHAPHTQRRAWCHGRSSLRTRSHCALELVQGEPVDGSTGLSSRPADPAHKAIDSISGASSSMQAAMREVVKVAMFEAPVTHPVDEVMRFFAMAAAYGSRTPRPCRRCMCYCILVGGPADSLPNQCTKQRTRLASSARQ